MMRNRLISGFTLIELLVAITIFAILATMAYAGLNTVLNTSNYAKTQIERIIKLQLAIATISRDMIHIVARPIRDEYGDLKMSFWAASLRSNNGMEFTRGNWRNPANLLRSSLQRIAYSIQERQLLRSAWMVLDRAQDTSPAVVALLDRVDGMALRFMDTLGAWHNQWPPENVNQNNKAVEQMLPRAIEINIDLADFGRITRVYPIYPSAARQNVQ